MPRSSPDTATGRLSSLHSRASPSASRWPWSVTAKAQNLVIPTELINNPVFRIAKYGTEKWYVGIKFGQNFAAGDDDSDWVAVAYWFANGDYIGFRTKCLEPPKMTARSAKSNLNLIGDVEPAGGLHFFHNG